VEGLQDCVSSPLNDSGTRAKSGTPLTRSRSRAVPPEHTGPICKGCGQPFYYDYIPERHDGSGYCWICFGEHSLNVPVQP
jgi:hypothetical protein